jgi:hypothetical protein
MAAFFSMRMTPHLHHLCQPGPIGFLFGNASRRKGFWQDRRQNAQPGLMKFRQAATNHSQRWVSAIGLAADNLSRFHYNLAP